MNVVMLSCMILYSGVDWVWLPRLVLLRGVGFGLWGFGLRASGFGLCGFGASGLWGFGIEVDSYVYTGNGGMI